MSKYREIHANAYNIRSTNIGLKMGLINELPINKKYASRLTQEHINDPFMLVDALKANEFEERSPLK
jgi:hypothetical protein